jgi:putative salt-induced outer membrane protein YdiY
MRNAMVCAFLVVGLAAPAAAADELQLRNGDRLTGDVVTLQGGKLTFKTSFGELVVPWTDIGAIRLDAPMLVTAVGAEPRMTTLEGVALSDVVALAMPTPPFRITGAANAGLLSTGGNTDISAFNASGEVAARWPHDRLTTAAVHNRAEDAGRLTTRNATASANYDRFITERLFATGSAIFTNDRFRDLDLRSAIGAGLGYEVWNNASSSFSVEGGVAYVREDFAEATTESYTAAREAARLNAFLMAKRVEVFHQHGGYFGVTGEDNVFLRMQNGVRFSLIAGLVSTVQLDIDYDKSPAPGRKTTDRTTSFTLGYRF